MGWICLKLYWNWGSGQVLILPWFFSLVCRCVLACTLTLHELLLHHSCIMKQRPAAAREMPGTYRDMLRNVTRDRGAKSSKDRSKARGMWGLCLAGGKEALSAKKSLKQLCFFFFFLSLYWMWADASPTSFQANLFVCLYLSWFIPHHVFSPRCWRGGWQHTEPSCHLIECIFFTCPVRVGEMFCTVDLKWNKSTCLISVFSKPLQILSTSALPD